MITAEATPAMKAIRSAVFTVAYSPEPINTIENANKETVNTASKQAATKRIMFPLQLTHTPLPSVSLVQ